MVLSLQLLPLFKLAAGNLVHKYDMHEGRSTVERERGRKNLNCKGEREGGTLPCNCRQLSDHILHYQI